MFLIFAEFQVFSPLGQNHAPEHLPANENEPANEAGSADDPVHGDSAVEHDGVERANRAGTR